MKKSIEEFVEGFSEKRKALCRQIMALDGFDTLPGSLTKHQVWRGGYRDHITDIMNIAARLYPTMSQISTLPFTLNDALFILFLHDLDKLLTFAEEDKKYVRRSSVDKAESLAQAYLDNAVYLFSEVELNALKYVHGEGKDHNPDTRVMSELAAFVHCCDTISARIWYDKISYA